MGKLFEQTSIGSMNLKNRIVMAPMGSGFPNADGTVSQKLIDYLVRRAVGGAGLIVVEYCSPDPVQILIPTELKLSDDKYIEGMSKVPAAIKAAGAKAALQLMHPGRGAMSMFTGTQPVAPSPILFDWPFLEQPRELPPEEISVIADRFAEAARRAKDAGFDAVEIHGAHGHLVAQFLSPHSNKRSDEYGGDVHGRARFATEIVARTREKVGPHFPILFRMSGHDYVDGGGTLKEAKITAKLLEEAGVDALSVSAGVYPFSLEWIIQPMLIRTGCLVPLAAEIRKEVNIPVMVAGRINSPKLAETIVEEGKADLVVLGRALLADPDLPRKAREGKAGEITQCIACNTCVQAERGMGPVRCLMNPELGREGEVEPKAHTSKAVVVIGGGPAGLEAARVAANRGHRVELWDEDRKLGGRWSWLISPYIKEMVSTLKGLGVSIRLGKAVDLAALNRANPDAVIATVGKSPVAPQIPGVERGNVHRADDVLEGKVEVGERAAILGAGNIGFEVAEFLSRRRVQISIVDSASEAGHGVERDAKKLLTDRFRDRGIRIWTGSEVLRITDGGLHFRDPEGKERSADADTVVLALDSVPDNTKIEALQSGDFELFTVGFCERPEGVYSSTREGASIARQI